MSKAFVLYAAEDPDRGPDRAIATLASGALFYPRQDGVTFDWPAGTRGDGGLWNPHAMSDAELISLRYQLVTALTTVEDKMAERAMFRRYTDGAASR